MAAKQPTAIAIITPMGRGRSLDWASGLTVGTRRKNNLWCQYNE